MNRADLIDLVIEAGLMDRNGIDRGLYYEVSAKDLLEELERLLEIYDQRKNKVVKFPASSVLNISAGLRTLADKIDDGEFGSVLNVAWIMDADGVQVSGGLLGQAGSPDAVFCLLCDLGKRRIIEMMGR